MKKLKNYLAFILLVIILGSFFYQIIHRVLTDFLIKRYPVHTKAIVINEKNYYPHSYVTHDFAYSYTFTVDGKTYTNNSHNINSKIGDTIEIEYVKNFPSFNKPIHTTD
jgi:hypothetical protein